MLRKSTNSGRRSAVITGALLISGLVTGIFSVVPVIDGADYLVMASKNENQVLTGAFFQLLMVVAYVGIPILMYPIVCKHNKGLALGSVAFGIIAGVFIIIGVIILLLLLTVSNEFAQFGTLNVSYFQTLGGLLREGRDLVNHVATTLAFVLAMFLFNRIFYPNQISSTLVVSFGSYWVYNVHIGKLIIYVKLHWSRCNLLDVEHSNSLSTIGFGFMANHERIRPNGTGYYIQLSWMLERRRCN
ncbi:UNVERIFIED_CONTAM: hypothetical protein ABID98_002445 [Brevibacillus sp. OAP136]